MHKWVDQFAIEPKSLFTQNHGQNLEITIIIHYFTLISSIFFHVINGTFRVSISLII
jgi:hypothetical protein